MSFYFLLYFIFHHSFAFPSLDSDIQRLRGKMHILKSLHFWPLSFKSKGQRIRKIFGGGRTDFICC